MSEQMREQRIGREQAKAILTGLDRLDDYDDLGDYSLAFDEDGREYLVCWGQDLPLAENLTTTSWSSPGYPASVEGLVCGCQVQVDRSGQGHCWVDVDAADLPASVREEIEAEILDGNEDCDVHVAGNGLHYRW